MASSCDSATAGLVSSSEAFARKAAVRVGSLTAHGSARKESAAAPRRSSAYIATLTLMIGLAAIAASLTLGLKPNPLFTMTQYIFVAASGGVLTIISLAALYKAKENYRTWRGANISY